METNVHRIQKINTNVEILGKFNVRLETDLQYIQYRSHLTTEQSRSSPRQPKEIADDSASGVVSEGQLSTVSGCEVEDPFTSLWKLLLCRRW